MNRRSQERKVSTGIDDTSQGSLGDVLHRWNASYFSSLGLHAQLELSDSVMRRPEHKSRIIRKPSLLYRGREQRDWKREDRKFVMVISRTDCEASPAGKLLEVGSESGKVELPTPREPRAFEVELPGEGGRSLAELETPEDKAKEDLADVLCGVAELPADVPLELPAGSLLTEPTCLSKAGRSEDDWQNSKGGIAGISTDHGESVRANAL